MSEQTTILGKLVGDDANRDAIHIAVAPVVAAENLFPGQDIGLCEDGRVASVSPVIGIVDPFLKHRVVIGDRFYMLLYPNTITSLRHEWVHPAFEKRNETRPSARDSSEQWLRSFAEQAGLSYDSMLEKVAGYVEDGDPWVENGSEMARDAYYAVNEDEFWKHYEAVTGTKNPHHSWSSPFSCSC